MEDARAAHSSVARAPFGPVARALRELASRLGASPSPAEGSFLRLEATVDAAAVGPDLLDWLRGAPPGARRYFRDRSGRIEVAGIGVATAGALGVHEAWRQDGGATTGAWFLGECFDNERERDPDWAPFAAASCVLPVVELRRHRSSDQGDGHEASDTLAVHHAAGMPRTEVLALIESILASLATASTTCAIEPALVRERDAVDEVAWSSAVEASLARIREGGIRKIVHARLRRYTASSAIDPVGLLSRVAARESRGFRFLLEAGRGRAFLGVTPERLYARHGRMVRSEAVAGTRPRGVDGVADRLLGESLLASAKDRREHEFVVEQVRGALASRSSTLRIDAEPRLLRLAYVQHLCTRLVGELRTGIGDLELVKSLHPTPAVAGAPVREAVELLRTHEPFDRGLYAGPVGLVGQDGAEVAVAIRSARVDGDALVAYAGAGIVEGSDPAEEWRETGHKLLAFERLAT